MERPTEKSWFAKEVDEPRALGDEDGNEEEKRERESKENGPRPQSTFPSRGARVSVGILILRCLGRGRGPRETRPPAGRVGGPLLVSLSLVRVVHGREEWGAQKMHPWTQPLSK